MEEKDLHTSDAFITLQIDGVTHRADPEKLRELRLINAAAKGDLNTPVTLSYTLGDGGLLTMHGDLPASPAQLHATWIPDARSPQHSVSIALEKHTSAEREDHSESSYRAAFLTDSERTPVENPAAGELIHALWQDSAHSLSTHSIPPLIEQLTSDAQQHNIPIPPAARKHRHRTLARYTAAVMAKSGTPEAQRRDTAQMMKLGYKGVQARKQALIALALPLAAIAAFGEAFQRDELMHPATLTIGGVSAASGVYAAVQGVRSKHLQKREEAKRARINKPPQR